MSSHQLLILMFIGFLFIMGFLYVLVSLWEKYITQSHKKKADRQMMDQLGEEKVTYSNDYFNKLSQRSRTTDNLPTRSCDKCGAGLDPENKFCPICGYDISDWTKTKN